ncbi:MAG: ATP-binding cassette domain-containing protein [Actinobacteria bacterium]|nr:ATP-binding cassette domain-containing protein [Actinomycetota bacterium]
MPLLEFDKVSKRYKSIQALAETSFSVSPGESIGIIGESGSGKTTLASIATGLVRPSSGRVLIDGQALSGEGKSRRRNARTIQLIWQDTRGSVDPRLNVGRIIEEPLRVHDLLSKDDPHGQVAGLLNEVGLSGKLAGRYPHELSGGELQRIVIARALALSPGLLICDELAASLDIHAKLKVARLLTRLQSERNLALIVIAHDLSLVGRMTRELLVMNNGVIVERGATDLLMEKPSHQYTQSLIGCDPSVARGILA